MNKEKNNNINNNETKNALSKVYVFGVILCIIFIIAIVFGIYLWLIHYLDRNNGIKLLIDSFIGFILLIFYLYLTIVFPS